MVHLLDGLRCCLNAAFCFLQCVYILILPKNLTQFFLNLENDFLQNKIPRNYHVSKQWYAHGVLFSGLK